MGLFKGLSNADPKQTEAAIEKAREAWEAGRRCHIYKPLAMSSLDGDALTDAVEGMLDLGWELASTALTFNSTGVNTEQAMFTFLRPR